MAEQFDNPSNVTQGETKSLDVVILQGMESRLRTFWIAMPAEVTKVRNNSFVDVQPHFQIVLRDGTVKTLPVVQGVPVKNLSGKDWWIKAPVAVGDVGTLLVHDRSLDAWIVQGGVVNPADPRIHDLSDCEFMPGLPTQKTVLAGNADDLILHNGKAEIALQKPGTFLVRNDSQELFDLVDQFIELASTLQSIASTLVSDLTTIPAGITTAPASPIAPNPAFTAAMGTLTSQLSTLSTQLSTLKTNLETLKGS